MKLYDVIVAEKKEKGKQQQRTEPEEIEYYDDEYTPKRIRRHIIIYGLLFLFLAGIYALGITFVHASVHVEERKIPFTLAGASLDLEHEKNADPGRLTYQAMVITTTITREVIGSEVTTAETKAAGPIVFINEYSKAAITIASGTTLVSQDKNLKYITKDKVIVPGYTTTNGKKVAGSSAPVTLIATATGGNYNTTGTSFSVAAYSGTKRTQLYARSTGPITGGESGTHHTISTSEHDTIIDSLRTQLIERLRRETRAQIPEGFITYPDLQVVTVDPNSLVIEGDDLKFPASLSGVMVSYLIPVKDFEQAISGIALSDHQYPTVSIPAINDLSVTPISPLSQSTTEFPNVVSVKISGQGTIITTLDEKTIQDALVGQKRSNFETILEKIPEINHATFSMLPFWSPFFPSSANRIKVSLY